MSERYWILIHFDAPCPPEAKGPFDLDEAKAFIEKETHFAAGYTLVKEVGEGADEQE